MAEAEDKRDFLFVKQVECFMSPGVGTRAVLVFKNNQGDGSSREPPGQLQLVAHGFKPPLPEGAGYEGTVFGF